MSIVSVVVATYRRDSTLTNALESLITQTYKDIEIILVDDNANEEWNKKVGAILENFKENYPTVSIKYILNSSNQGSAKTRNTGIEAALGKYVTFLDDDDVYLPEKIEHQIEFMENNGYDYSITDLELYNENEKLIDKRTRNYIKDTSTEALLKYHLKYHITGTDAMMFTKEYLVKIGGFAPIDVGDEFYLMQKAIEGNGKFGYLSRSDIKAYVHVGDGGLSSGEGKIKGENALYDYKKTFFDKMDSKTKRYIRMRHYAVLSFAGLRMKKLGYALSNGLKSFFIAPFQCIKLVIERKI